jgi:hypothetical protein
VSIAQFVYCSGRALNPMGVVMPKRLEFEVEGPFEIPLDRARRRLDLSGLWSGDLEHLSNCCGCYVLALKSVKGSLTPIYVGLTKRRFRDEVFNRSNLSRYGAAIAQSTRSRVVMFLITPPGRKGKVDKSYIGELESFLIQAASARNPELQHWKGVDRPKWLIRGVTGRAPGKTTIAARRFRAAMGIES